MSELWAQLWYLDLDGPWTWSDASGSGWLEWAILSWGSSVPDAPLHSGPTAHLTVLGGGKARPLCGNGKYQPHENPPLGVSREKEWDFYRQPCGPCLPWPAILLKRAAEEHQLGWSVQKGRYIYSGKAQPCLSLCTLLCRMLLPAIPSQSRDGEGWGSSACSPDKAMSAFIPAFAGEPA